ncbi:hypothetical protein [Hymenobacter jeollabukensis]|uniref:Uncharacterized protein n=1 Tax=Hymenobacter jeollabukensis TaxID=2025313 RepID=A0A5R8WJN2_9BACT|nr:hypothetical protein [Hymenobacter jeollabukensis]TLM89056.1 hypothetical protein FDY95_21030 [Hymenobacter jeollabukensis]
MSNQRSQNDPKASQNQGQQQSNQSSDKAQHVGSIEGNRSVHSGVSGIPSQRHEAEDSSTAALNRDQAQGPGTAPTDKHGKSRVQSDASDE